MEEMGQTEKKPFPRWDALSAWGKVGVLCILFGPPALALLIWADRAELARVSDWAFGIAILIFSFIAFRWAFDRDGYGRPWWLEFRFRRLLAGMSKDPGTTWMKWAKKDRSGRAFRDMVERAALAGNPEGLYEWGWICKGEMREDSAWAAFLEAARRGHPGAAWEMGEAARWGLYMTPMDPAESRRWHEKAARAGHLPSIRILASPNIGAAIDSNAPATNTWRKRLRDIEAEQTAQFSGTPSERGAGERTGRAKKPPAFGSDRLSEPFAFLFRAVEALLSGIPLGFTRALIPTVFWGGLSLLLIFVLSIQFSTWLGALFSVAGIPAVVALIRMHMRAYRPDRSLSKLQKRAGKGQPEAMYGLGMAYRTGAPQLPQDFTLAAQWFERAAGAGHPGAMLELGLILAWGRGAPQDPIAAVKWLRAARAMGLVEADVHLGRMAGME